MLRRQRVCRRQQKRVMEPIFLKSGNGGFTTVFATIARRTRPARSFSVLRGHPQMERPGFESPLCAMSTNRSLYAIPSHIPLDFLTRFHRRMTRHRANSIGVQGLRKQWVILRPCRWAEESRRYSNHKCTRRFLPPCLRAQQEEPDEATGPQNSPGFFAANNADQRLSWIVKWVDGKDGAGRLGKRLRRFPLFAPPRRRLLIRIPARS